MQYRIVEWDRRYEVDDRGREWTAGKIKRKWPLAFLRLKVHGRAQGAGWRKLVQRAGKARALATFGLFCKVLELAGDKEREDRGVVVDDPGTGNENDLAWLLSVSRRQVDAALDIMCGIGWIEIIPTSANVDNVLDVKMGSRAKSGNQSKTLLEKRKTCKSARGAEKTRVTLIKKSKKRAQTDDSGAVFEKAPEIEKRVTSNTHFQPHRSGLSAQVGTDSRELPGTPGNSPYNRTEPNRTEQNRTYGRARARDGSEKTEELEAVASPSEPGPSPWTLARQEARTAFGPDPGIAKALTNIANSLLSDRPGLDQAAGTIRELVAEAMAKGDKPRAYFMGALQKRWPAARQKGGKPDGVALHDEVAKMAVRKRQEPN